MFIELPAAVQYEENKYNILVNLERVMWAVPLEDGTCCLYMNVADNQGRPVEVIVDIDYPTLRDKFLK